MSTTSECSAINVDGIYNNDQGYFRNIPTSQISNYPILNLALLSNSCGDRTPDVEINLNPTYLSWSDFTNLFFKSPSGVFYINPSNNNVSAITFASQTYETTYNQNVAYSLADQTRKAWSKINSKPETAIQPKVNIQLERQCFLTKSLGSVYGDFIGLSYDEAISSLLTSGSIAVGDCDTSAIVKFTIAYQYYCEQLNICLLTTFTYITNIPCYKNTIPFSDDCVCPYSNDTKVVDRAGLDLNDDMSVFSDFESKNGANNGNDNKANNLDEYSIASGSSNIISEISKIINGAESIGTSEW